MKKQNNEGQKQGIKLSKKQIKVQAKKDEKLAIIEEKRQKKIQKKQKRKGRGKRMAKRLLIIGSIVGVFYVSYLILLKPNGFTTSGDVTKSFIANLEQTSVCEDHFNAETSSICDTIVDSLEGSDVEFVEARIYSNNMENN